MALSLAAHGLAVLPLFLITGPLGSATQEPSLVVEFTVAAPTVGTDAGPDAALADLPPSAEAPLPTPVEMAATPETQAPAEPPPPEHPTPAEIAAELPPPDDPPPLSMTELKPAEPPKPKPAAPSPSKPAAPRPVAKPATAAARAAATPDSGDAAVTQEATAAPTDTIVFEARPRYRVPPKPAVYPARAIELGQQGEVLIRVRLDLDGSAAEIKLWRSSGFDILDRSALAAVRGWHFHPAMRGGHPVAAWVEIPVRFHLH